MGIAPGHGEYDDNTLIRMNLKFKAPIADPATQYSFGSSEEFNVTMIRVGAHVLEGIIDALKVGTRHIAKVARSWLSYR
jgi:hypothetical protein